MGKHKALAATIAVLVVGFGALFGGRYYANQRAAAANRHRAQPLVAVSTAVAHEGPWSPEVDVVGSLEAVQGTALTAQIAGNVTAIAFRSGQTVKQGQLLVQLDDTNQRAQLHADQARQTLAHANRDRARKLYVAHAVSQSDLQTTEANAAAADAAVEGDEATLRKLDIAAPFAGKAGIRAVSLGQYVSPGTPIVDLQSDDPLLLDFALPQDTVSALSIGQDVAFTVNAYAGRVFHGKVTALGARVDPATRNIALQATVPNSDHALRPGMYGSVRMTVGEASRGIVVPDSALTFNTFGDNVFIVQGDAAHGQSVRQQVVKVAGRRNGKVLVASGLADGDTVVTAGQQKLRDGTKITVDNTVQP